MKYRNMIYLISEIILYLLIALFIGFAMGWILRGLQQSRYTHSLQRQLGQRNEQH